MGKIISVINNKGGVGKSTTVYNLGYELSNLGKRTLIVDLDAQSSLSVYVGLDPMEQYANIDNIFRKNMDILDVIIQTGNKNLYMIPSSIDFSTIEMYLMGVMGRENVLKKALMKIKEKFDFIILDNSPSIGNVSINSLMASDYIIAPIDASYLSVRALDILEKTVEEVKEYNKNLHDIKVLITMFNNRTMHGKEVLNMLSTKYYVFNDKVKESTKFKDAVMQFSSISQFAGPNWDGAVSYKNVAKEILRW